ncbi:hypothetical protein DXG01_001358 [Tephrocybe rancida]|nr:hypothetical protein DXG01_001358 [Tephrocybe rancida]
MGAWDTVAIPWMLPMNLSGLIDHLLHILYKDVRLFNGPFTIPGHTISLKECLETMLLAHCGLLHPPNPLQPLVPFAKTHQEFQDASAHLVNNVYSLDGLSKIPDKIYHVLNLDFMWCSSGKGDAFQHFKLPSHLYPSVGHGAAPSSPPFHLFYQSGTILHIAGDDSTPARRIAERQKQIDVWLKPSRY